tara:strand:- start:207 stop:950 length:744 start_codon:yes stop_codon:yes gene_type:complete
MQCIICKFANHLILRLVLIPEISSFQKGLENIEPLASDLLIYKDFIIKSVSLGDCCSFIWKSEDQVIEEYREHASDFFVSKSKLVSLQTSEKRKEVLDIFNEFLVKNKMMNQAPFLKFTYTIHLEENAKNFSLLVQEVPFYDSLLNSFVIVNNVSHLKLKDSNVSVTNIQTGKFFPRVNLVHKEGKQLSKMEKTIIGLIISGKNNKSIADYCNRSEETVKSYRKKILKKLDAKNMFEAVTLFKTSRK